MARVKDFYRTSPSDLQAGDVLVCTVTLHVSHFYQENSIPYFRMYKAGFPPQQTSEDGIPQGIRIFLNEDDVAKALFPIANQAGMKSEG